MYIRMYSAHILYVCTVTYIHPLTAYPCTNLSRSLEKCSVVTFPSSEDLSAFFLGRGGLGPLGGFPLLATDLRDSKPCRCSRVSLTASSGAVKDRQTHK